MATTDLIFVASPEGFRSQNIDRPPAHLVRELVQNALDEAGVTQLDVTVTFHGPRQGTTVRVVDNAPQGVKDERLLFTLWLSDKEDSPLKRGRMGRGLKEIVSVANKTTIRSMGIDALQFERKQGGEWSRRTLPKLGRTEVGTEVTSFCRAWGESAAKSIVTFIKRVRAPSTVELRVAFVDERAAEPTPVFERVVPFVATERYQLYLPTVIYELDEGDRKARDRHRHADVECFTPPPGEQAYIYELGIPVEKCESSPVSIDVQQRVILRERRDTVTDSYRRQLLAEVLNKRVKAGLVTGDELRSNAALVAAQSMYSLDPDVRRQLADAWTGGLPYSTGKDDFQRATAHHVQVVALRTLPEAIREVVKYAGTSVTSILETRKEEFCPVIPTEKLDLRCRKLITFWGWLSAGLKRPCTVRICAGKPSAGADFNRTTQTLTLYAEMLGDQFFDDPAGAMQLGVFLHELAHWAPRENEHGIEFHSDAENIGGKLAAFMLNNAEQARLQLKGEVGP
ncbi:MAG: ATP-binding protein [Salinibacterium sp.]|nr:MAG: ATP-binding protein [Salinibacterium sp.]